MCRPAARFEPDHAVPKSLVADGTIYGQIFPAPGSRVKIHYCTLWDQDCGRTKHPLDAEHVLIPISMGLEAEPEELYWYAGAHETTTCEMSSGGHVEAVTIPHNHRIVWSSSGKYAPYFRKEMCGQGCGGDSCQDAIELPRSGRVTNIGELAWSMYGSSWVKSPTWPVADRMDSDFTSDVMAQLEPAPRETILTLRGSP